MTRKIILLCAVGTFALTGCKKTETLSAEDPSSGIAAPIAPTETAPDTVNIGPAPMPETNTPPPANGKYPVMSFEKTEHDFGTINEGAKVTYTFNFKNTGASDLIISNAVGSCGCTVPEYPKEPVKPGESGKLKVSFNSAGKSGNQHKNVTVSTNTQTGKEIINIKANITPKAGSGVISQ